MVVAISAALRVLGYQELAEEDVPPEEYWHSEDRLSEWFASVKQRRKGRASGMESIDTGEDLDEDSYSDPDVESLRGR